MTKNFALLHCHSSESMPEVAPETVQLVITSPLYFPPDTEPFLYGEKDCGMSPGVAFDRVQAFASETLRSVMDECVRVLAPGGHLVLETRDVRIGTASSRSRRSTGASPRRGGSSSSAATSGGRRPRSP